MTPNPKTKPIRLTGAAYKEFRREVWLRAGGLCERCKEPAPRYNSNGEFDLHTCGHVSHIKSRGAGGQDILSNVRWYCWKCHLVDTHGPKWSKRK